jgi:glycosyltransferase involved in cell wall biosynthesis
MPGLRSHRVQQPLFVAWTSNTGRMDDLAATFGGKALLPYPLGGFTSTVGKLARYAASALMTVVGLVRARPAAVVVTNPPILPCVLVGLYASLTGIPWVIDSHPGGFGGQGDTVSGRLVPVLRFLTSRCSAVLVTTPRLSEIVCSWGGTPIILHEPALDMGIQSQPRDDGPILFVGVFQRDEPVAAIIDAARLLPEEAFWVTGDLAKAPPGLLEEAPRNVHFVGFLRADAYRAALLASRIVISLTTDPDSVMRSGFDAIWSSRPLIVSDTATTRATFPFARHATNDGAAIAEAIRDLQRSRDQQQSCTEAARQLAITTWARQEAALYAVLRCVMDPP